MATFDMMEQMQISFRAAVLANDENPEYEGRLIDIVTDDHIGRAIKEYFAECEEWNDNLLPAALKMYHETEAFERQMEGFCRQVVGSIMGGAFP